MLKKFACGAYLARGPAPSTPGLKNIDDFDGSRSLSGYGAGGGQMDPPVHPRRAAICFVTRLPGWRSRLLDKLVYFLPTGRSAHVGLGLAAHFCWVVFLGRYPLSKGNFTCRMASAPSGFL